MENPYLLAQLVQVAILVQTERQLQNKMLLLEKPLKQHWLMG